MIQAQQLHFPTDFLGGFVVQDDDTQSIPRPVNIDGCSKRVKYHSNVLACAGDEEVDPGNMFSNDTESSAVASLDRE